MNKNAYRTYFKTIRDFVNLALIYKSVGIQQPNFSRFMTGTDSAISEDKIIYIKGCCDELFLKMREAELVFREELNR